MSFKFVITAQQARDVAESEKVQSELKRAREEVEFARKQQQDEKLKIQREQEILQLEPLFAEIDIARQNGKHSIDVDKYTFTPYQKEFLESPPNNYKFCSGSLFDSGGIDHGFYELCW